MQNTHNKVGIIPKNITLFRGALSLRLLSRALGGALEHIAIVRGAGRRRALCLQRLANNR